MEQGDDHAQSSDEVDEMYCELCKAKGRSNAADGFCVDCVKYFCSNCLDFHSEFLPNHVHEDKNNMPKDVCVKPCFVHGNKIIKFYCSACEQFFCSECKLTNHSGCTSVSHLPAFVKALDISKECNDINEKLRINLKEIERRQLEGNRKTQIAVEYAEKAKSALLLKKTAVLQWLNQNVANIEKEIEEIQKADEQAVQSEDAALSAIKNQTHTLQTEMNNKHVLTNRCNMFMVMKKTEIQQKQLLLKLRQVQEPAETCYEFESSDDFERLIGEISLGNISKKKSGIEMQKSTVEECLQRPLIHGELWFIVDIKWFKQWKSYVGYDSLGDHEDKDSAHPGPIDNSPILKEGTGAELKEGLTDNRDYALLPEDCWKHLLAWYGIVDGQDPLSRKVISNKQALKIEVYPLCLKICKYSDTDKQLPLVCSLEETIGNLKKNIQDMFDIGAEVPVRLWKRKSISTYLPYSYAWVYEQLDKEENTLGGAELYQGNAIVIEQQNTDGTWPRDKLGANTKKKRKERKEMKKTRRIKESIDD